MQTSKPRGGIGVSKIDKYIVSFLFDAKGLKLSLLKKYLFVFFFFSFLKLKIITKLEQIRIFILKVDLANSRPN